MRNLKKILSLALALVMVFSLMTFASAADFGDGAEVDHAEAVDVLDTLGVIKGYEDGNFYPDRVVKRGEMAKMIAYIVNGGKDPVLNPAEVSYNDTANHWAKGYIEYCTGLGIVSGYGDGSFKPDNTVTGTEAAKMLLIAMGYNSDIREYTGANWSLNVGVDANQKGLYGDLTYVNPSDGLDRDATAQMVYNALCAKGVQRGDSISVEDGKVTYRYDDDSKTVMARKLGVYKVEGVVTDNEFTQGSTLKGKTRIDVTNFVDVAYNSVETPDNPYYEDGEQNFVVDTDPSLIGKSVVLLVKPASNNLSNSEKATVLGTAIESDNNVLSIGKTLKNDPTKDNDITKVLKAAGLKLSGSVELVENYATSTVAGSAAALAGKTGAGIEVSFIDNDNDGIVDYVTVLNASFGKVSSVNTAGDGYLNIKQLGAYKATITNDGTNGTAVVTNVSTAKAHDEVADFADLSLAKDDYVRYFAVVASGLYHIEVMEPEVVDVTGTIGDAVNGDKVVVGSTKYGKSALAGSDLSEENGPQSTLPEAVEINKSAALYLDKFNNIIYVDQVETESHYLMITDLTGNNLWNDELSAKVILSDGTTQTISIAKLDKKKLSKDGAGTNEIKVGTGAGDTGSAWETLDGKLLSKGTAAKIFSYTVDTNGKYELTTVAGTKYQTAAAGSGTAVLTNNNPSISTTTGYITVDNTTPIVIKSGSDVNLYTGIGSAPTRQAGKDSAVYLYAVWDTVASPNYTRVVFVNGGTASTSPDNYVYFLNKLPTVTKNSDGKEIYTYDVVRNGEVTTVEGESAHLLTDSYNAGLYRADFTGGKVSAVTVTDPRIVRSAKATRAEDGVITVGGQSYYYDSNTKVMIIKGSKATEASIDAVITTSGSTSQDDVALILGDQTSNTKRYTAEYVFIVRDDVTEATKAVQFAVVSSAGDATPNRVGGNIHDIAIKVEIQRSGAVYTVTLTPTLASGQTVETSSVTTNNKGSSSKAATINDRSSDLTAPVVVTIPNASNEIGCSGGTITFKMTVVENKKGPQVYNVTIEVYDTDANKITMSSRNPDAVSSAMQGGMPVENTGDLSVDGAFNVDAGQSLKNSGTITVTEDTQIAGNLEITGTDALTATGKTVTVAEGGTLKMGTGGITADRLVVNGTVELSGGTVAGDIQIGETGKVVIGGTVVLGAGKTLSGSGSVDISSGSLKTGANLDAMVTALGGATSFANNGTNQEFTVSKADLSFSGAGALSTFSSSSVDSFAGGAGKSVSPYTFKLTGLTDKKVVGYTSTDGGQTWTLMKGGFGSGVTPSEDSGDAETAILLLKEGVNAVQFRIATTVDDAKGSDATKYTTITFKIGG